MAMHNTTMQASGGSALGQDDDVMEIVVGEHRRCEERIRDALLRRQIIREKQSELLLDAPPYRALTELRAVMDLFRQVNEVREELNDISRELRQAAKDEVLANFAQRQQG